MKLIFNFDALNQQKLKGSSVKPIWDCHIVKESIEWMLKQQWQVLIADENGLTLKKIKFVDATQKNTSFNTWFFFYFT